MYVVGLTGGIGSGKSAVSDYLQTQGITVVDADVVSRQVVEPGTEALHQIEKHFGSDFIATDGTLDRAKLRQRIFTDSAAKEWLEQLLHPLIGAETFKQVSEATSPYVIYVTPLLVESKQYEMCNEVIVVDVTEETQINRTMQRDNNDAEMVKAIINSQASRDDRLAIATHVLNNNGALEELITATEALHQQLSLTAKRHNDNNDHK